MKKITLVAIMACLMVVFACPAFGSIFANPQVGDTVWFDTSNANGINNGGPFGGHLGLSYPNTGSYWDTFCVETDGAPYVEYFSPNTDYKVLGTSPDTATGSGNFVTNQAKWLYWMYGTDQSQLVGYTGTNANNASLQDAIWYAVHKGSSGGAPLVGALSGDALTWWTAADTFVTNNSSSPIYDSVRVVNPGYNSDTTEAQSMLYAVPEPLSILIWSLFGLGSMFGFRVCSRRGKGFDLGGGSATQSRRTWSDESRIAIRQIIERGCHR